MGCVGGGKGSLSVGVMPRFLLVHLEGYQHSHCDGDPKRRRFKGDAAKFVLDTLRWPDLDIPNGTVTLIVGGTFLKTWEEAGEEGCKFLNCVYKWELKTAAGSNPKVKGGRQVLGRPWN